MSGLPESKGTTVSQFATHAGEPGVIYAANNRGLFRSDDAGRSWKALDLPWPEPGLQMVWRRLPVMRSDMERRSTVSLIVAVPDARTMPRTALVRRKSCKTETPQVKIT